MTWAKYGVEFYDQCADVGLSDAAVRTHSEALHYLYRTETADMRIRKHLVRRFAGSDQWEVAARDLVAIGFWRDDGDAWLVEHHGNVFRESLAAQLKHRETERERQRRKRRSSVADLPPDVGPNEDANVGPNVGPNVRATQTDRQTDNHAVEKDRNASVRPDSERISEGHGVCAGCGRSIEQWILETRDGRCITCFQAIRLESA